MPPFTAENIISSPPMLNFFDIRSSEAQPEFAIFLTAKIWHMLPTNI